jgi:imidazolonepropionase-like amidohydrolase
MTLRHHLFLTAAMSVGAGAAAWGQRAPVAITDVTVIDGTGGPALERMTVVVSDGRIIAVESMSRADVPAHANVVDGRGKFLIPGLWDMHVHLTKAGATSLGLFVASGVTSVRDVGGDFAVVQQWRSEIAAGTRVGPRIKAAGPILESAARVRRMKAERTVEAVDRYRAPVADTTDARRVVDSLARLGVDLIKVRTVASRESYHAIAAAARRAGLALAAHGNIVPPEEMLQAGQRSIEHAIYPALQKRDARVRAQLIRELADAQVAIVPTMVNYYQWLLVPPADARRIVEDTAGRIDARRRYVSGYLLEDWREQVRERGRVKDALIRRPYLRRAYRGVLRDWRDMHRAGVRILPGTDVAVALMYPGFSLWDELGYFVEKIGMTPMEALVSATRSAAEFSGMVDSLGTVQVGKLADLVLLDADPLADIRNVGKIHAVVARGELFDRAALSRILAVAARPAR